MTAKRKTILWVAIAALFLIFGVIFLARTGSRDRSQTASGQVWTCSMHPQVRLPKDGTCPICEMPLTPAKAQSASGTNGATHAVVELSEHARAMAAVETVPVERRKLEATLRAVGKVQPNETTLAAVVSRVDGYVERLFVNFTGLEVQKGHHLAEIYSPDLIVAQQELLLASGAATETTRLKLVRLGLTDAQVDELIQRKKVTERVTLFSPIQGTVIEKMIVQNSPVKAGDVLYRLANLESVWVYLDVYEYELGRVQYGRSVELSAESYPGEVFVGRVWFISPVVTEETRTVKVLINIENRDSKLKPGMYVSAVMRVPLLANGEPAPSGLEGQWTCPMHPAVLQQSSGKCPICGMNLQQIPGVARNLTEEDQLVVSIPVTAVLDSGLRKLVYVEHAKGEYSPVEVTLGPRAETGPSNPDTFYPVLKGLSGGEQVVTRGNFLLDSQFQIQGLPSLFYPSGQVGSAGGHQHGGAAAPAPKGAAPGKSVPEHKH